MSGRRAFQGFGRVTVFECPVGGVPRVVMAYAPVPAADKAHGGAAVVAVANIAENPPEISLWSWAMGNNITEREQELARWLVCRGWAQMVTRAPNSFTALAGWSMDPDRIVDLDASYCGHSRLCIGRLAFADSAYAERASRMLAVPKLTRADRESSAGRQADRGTT